MLIETYVLAVLALLVVVVSLRHPMLAVAAFIALTLSYTPGILVNEHGLPSIGTLMVPALAGLLLVRTLARLEAPTAAIMLAPVALGFFILSNIGVFWASNPADARTDASELAKDITILLILVGFLTSPERRRWAIWTAALTIGAISALSLFQIVTNKYDNNFFGYANASLLLIAGERHDWRITGPLPDANFYAQLLLLILPLPIGLAICARSLSVKALALGLAALIFATVLFTYSRSALLALAVLAVVSAVATRRWGMLAIAGMFILTSVLMFMPESFTQRAQSGIDSARALVGQGDLGEDPAVVQRISVMRAAIRMFGDAPIFGIGPGQFASTYPGYALENALDLEAPPAAHNLYLEILAEQGLLGLMLFAGLVGSTLILSYRAVHLNKATGNGTEAVLIQAMILGLLGYLATSVFLHDAFPRFFWTFLALMVAFVAGAFLTDEGNRISGWRTTTMHDGTPAAMRRLWTGKRSIFPILLAGLLAAGTAYYQTSRTPARYGVEANLLYRFGREYYPITPTEVRRNWGENIILTLDNALATELHLLNSHEVAVATVRSLDDSVDPFIAVPVEGAESDEAHKVRAFAEMLNLQRVQGATMLSVEIEGTIPDTLDTLLDAFLDAYMDHREALFHSDMEEYFNKQISSLELELRSFEGEIAELRSLSDQASGRTDVPDQRAGRVAEAADERDEAALSVPASVENRLRHLEMRSQAVEERIVEMDGNRSDWRASREYTREVAPTVEVADRTPLARTDGQAETAVRVGAAGLAGGALVWLLFYLLQFGKRPETKIIS